MRKTVSAPELHDLLTREFAKTAGDLCLKCRLPMPVFRESRKGANWRLGALDECSTMCHSIVEDIAERLARQYDLRGP